MVNQERESSIESRTYPKDVPIIVGGAIVCRRCSTCGLVYFVNDKGFNICSECKGSF